MKIISIKFVSNSNLMLLDSQLEILSKQLNISLEYLKRAKKNGTNRVWLEVLDNGEIGDVIANQYGCQVFIRPAYSDKVTMDELDRVKPVTNPKRQGEDKPEEPKHIKLDLSKIIRIRLTLDAKSLTKIAEQYGINPEFLLALKQDELKYIWIQLGEEICVCESFTDNPEDVNFSKEYLPMTLKQKKSILAKECEKTPKSKAKTKVEKVEEVVESVVVEEEPIEYQLDNILDKISATGMQSLTKGEKEFLNNISKG